MFKRDTVIVLGAGSSKIFGLPLGSELRSILAQSLNIKFDDWGHQLISGSLEVVEAFRAYVKSSKSGSSGISHLIHASRDISDAMPMCSSIDDYIERHSDHGRHDFCAKIGIAHAILNAERKSPLRIDRRDQASVSRYENTWPSMLLQSVTRGVQRPQLREAFSKLFVINFNYDRCFEQFATYWLMQVYRIDIEEAKMLVDSISLAHPYGYLGMLTHSNRPIDSDFGAEPTAERLLQIASQIKTYSEAIEDDKSAVTARRFMTLSTQSVFLGFAFHQQNMDLLQIPESSRVGSRRIFSSRVGISNHRWDIIRGRLSTSLCVTDLGLFTFTEETCESLLQENADDL